jgi:hypothetical protein
MGVTVKLSGPPLANLQLSTKALMREVGLMARERIVRRTLSGIDMEGRAFQPYSAAYSEAKAKELGSASPVNLQVSGRMLQGLIIVDVTDESVTLGFKD